MEQNPLDIPQVGQDIPSKVLKRHGGTKIPAPCLFSISSEEHANENRIGPIVKIRTKNFVFKEISLSEKENMYSAMKPL